MKKILIVDDYEDLTNVLSIYLRSQGFLVQACSSSSEVFSKIYSFSPDLILLDVYLDQESGRSLCVKIKKQDSTKHIKVILFSASKFPESYLDECHHDDYIQKPFSIDELKEKILYHLGMSDKDNKD